MAAEFPAILKIEGRSDGSAGRAFVGEIDDLVRTSSGKLRSFSAAAERYLNEALNPKNGGSLNLDLPGMQRALETQRARSEVARELASATLAAARAEGVFSQETRESIAAQKALAAAEEAKTGALEREITTLSRVQAQLDRVTSSNGHAALGTARFDATMRASTVSAGAFRAGTQQLSFQIGDVAQELALGISPMVIFAQQGGQVVQAISLMRGTAGGLIGFLGGPWGAVIIGAATIIGTTLVPRLLEAEDATKKVEFASYGLGDAQSALGGVFDLTTGKIKTQSTALIALAKAQAIAGGIQARARQAEARSQISDIRAGEFTIRGGFGGGFAAGYERNYGSQVASQVLNGVIGYDVAIDKLNRAREAGSLTERQFIESAKAISAFGVEAENVKVFDQSTKALAGDKAALSTFLTPKTERTRKPRVDHSAEQAARAAERLGEFGEDSAKKIANIRDRFIDIPPAVAQASAATRELDDIISDIERRKPKGFEKMLADAEKLKAVIPDLGLDKAIGEITKAGERQYQLDTLILAGRDREAAVLTTMNRLEDTYGEKVRQRRGEIEKIVIAQQRANEALRKAQDLEQAYLGATQSVRAELESLFAGDGFDLQKIARKLTAQITVEAVFGDALRGLDRDVKGRFDIGAQELKGQAGLLGGAFDDLRGAARDLATTFRNPAVAASATGSQNDAAYYDFLGDFDKALPGGGGANDNEIVVTGTRDAETTARAIERSNTALGLTPGAYFDMLGVAIVAPLLRGLPPAIAGPLQGILGGAVGGYASAGPVGGILGAIKGGLFELGPDIFGKGLNDKLLKGAEGALGGAQTGTQVAGIGNALGVKLNSTGAQIGGAIGSFVPIPGGDIIGSIAGGLLGNLFKKTPSANLGITGLDGRASARGDGKLGENLGGLAGTLTSSIKSIADALNAQVGAFSVSLGQRGDFYRVGSSASFDAGSKYAKGSLYDGPDQQKALEIALRDALSDGAIKGLKAAQQRLLAAGADIQAAIQDVLDFRSVARRLKEYRDPVGAALDDLDDEFGKLRDVFQRAGASTAEYAQLEELYGIERTKAVQEAQKRVTGSLQGLLDRLNIGDSGLSLRDREANARAQYDPLAARVKAGDVTAFDDFSSKAQELLDIERQLFGSTSKYFDQFNAVQGVASGALDAQKAIADQSAARDSGLDAHLIRDGIDSQTGILSGDLQGLRGDIANLNENLITIGRQISGGGSASLADRYGLRLALS